MLSFEGRLGKTWTLLFLCHWSITAGFWLEVTQSTFSLTRHGPIGKSAHYRMSRKSRIWIAGMPELQCFNLSVWISVLFLNLLFFYQKFLLEINELKAFEKFWGATNFNEKPNHKYKQQLLPYLWLHKSFILEIEEKSSRLENCDEHTFFDEPYHMRK